MSEVLEELKSRVESCPRSAKEGLRRQIRAIERRLRQGLPADRSLARLEADVEEALRPTDDSSPPPAERTPATRVEMESGWPIGPTLRRSSPPAAVQRPKPSGAAAVRPPAAPERPPPVAPPPRRAPAEPAGAKDETGNESRRRPPRERPPVEFAPRAYVPGEIRFPDLPISAARQEIAEAIVKHQVVILGGETGSGKTTQLPKICLELGRGQGGIIGHTQPRRLAARSVATRIAEELGTRVGDVVGFKVRFTDETSSRSMVKLMTDGILLAETGGDPLLRAYDTIIIDEAHERSLNIDFLLGYLKRILPHRPDLKVIITSATIDLMRFSRHFDGAPVLEVSGRTYPVEVRYRPPPLEGKNVDFDDLDLPQLVNDAVEECLRGKDGDILVFLSGEREIRDCADTLRKMQNRGVEVLPLYARLAAKEQDKIWKPHGGRRVVLSTNVAETSLTVPGIRYVIDPGRARISRYGFRSKVQRLPIEAVSRASADQRKGRCGRVSDGVCIRLYSEADYLSRPQFTDPEILRTNLAAVILQMKALDLGDIHSFPFLEPPDRRQVTDGIKLLFELGAIDEDEELTEVGETLARLPVDPRLGRMLIRAHELECLSEVLVITSALSIQDPRERPHDSREAADNAHARFADDRSDFLSLLHLWRYFRKQQKELSGSALRKFCRNNFLAYLRMREWQDVHRQLTELCEEADMRVPKNTNRSRPEIVHRAILAGLLSHVGVKGERHDFQGAGGKRFHIHPSSVLFSKKPQWLMASELVETTKLYARTCAPIQPEWLEDAGEHLLKRNLYDPHWDEEREHVAAYERVTLFGLEIASGRKVHYAPHDHVRSRHIFLRALADASYRPRERFYHENVRLMKEVEALEARSRKRDVLVDLQSIYDFYAGCIPEHVVSGKGLREWLAKAVEDDPAVLCMTRADLMKHEAEEVNVQEYPEQLQVGENRLKLDYRFEPGHPSDGVTLEVPVATLPQVNAARCEWLVPGLLPEKVLALLRSLPKNLRRQLVPAPDVAARVLDGWQPGDARLLPALSARVKELTGVVVPLDAWDDEGIEEHLRMNFRVTDDEGVVLAERRHLAKLQSQMGGQVSRGLVGMAGTSYGQRGLTDWEFERLEDRVVLPGRKVELVGFPGLVDEGDSVALALLESRAKADHATRAGVHRLFRLKFPKDCARVRKDLPGLDRMTLAYSRIGGGDELQADLVTAAISLALFPADPSRKGEPAPIPRTRVDFENLCRRARAALPAAAERAGDLVARTLEIAHRVSGKLSGTPPTVQQKSYEDMRDQLAHLVYPGFVGQTPPEWLPQLPRYLEAMEKRLEKLSYAPAKDAERTRTVGMPWRGCKERLARHEEKGIFDPNLVRFRWLVEEFRVQTFAQELGTPIPVSWKKLEKLWSEIVA